MITLTLIRHGESTDNVKSVWAGWKDAPLSNHGMNQAKALGASLENVPLTAIFSSDLKRALWTGQQVQTFQRRKPQPSLTVTELLREQHFGDAEGQPWSLKTGVVPGTVDPSTGEKIWSVQEGRLSRFPNGESLQEVAKRIEEAFESFILPIVKSSEGKALGEVNVAVTSHGIAIMEMIDCILKRSSNHDPGETRNWGGLSNTGWTRLVLGINGEALEYDHDMLLSGFSAEAAAETPAKDKGEIIAEAVESANPSNAVDPTEPALGFTARVVAVSQAPHIAGLVRQKHIGSGAYDSKQKVITDFFAGGSKPQGKTNE